MHTLHQGDCLEIMPTLPAGSVDAIITDLPYGTTACEWDSIIPLAPMWEQVKRVLKVNGVFISTASQPFTTILINSNFDWFKYNWVWDKVVGANFMNLENRPFKTHEDILIFSSVASFTFNPIKTMRSESSLIRDPIGTNRKIKRDKDHAEYYGSLREQEAHPISKDGKKHPIDILRFSTRESGIVYKIHHPTKKPIALYEYLVRTYTNPGEIVLDFCMGSGTTGVSSVKNGRRFIGIEKKAEYFQIAKSRIEQAPPPLFIEPSTPANTRLYPDVGDSPAQGSLFTPEADTAEGKLPAPAPRR